MFDCTRDAFQISLQHDWQIENGFLMSQSRQAFKSWYTGGDPEQGFWHCFADVEFRLWCRLTLIG